MSKKSTEIYSALNSSKCLRIAFALCPNFGSDREVGWNALSVDRNKGRKVTYVTSRIDLERIKNSVDDCIVSPHGTVVDLGTIKICAWPFELPKALCPVGFLRYYISVIALQIYMLAALRNSSIAKVHFLTYTQLATPIFLQKNIKVWHGPAGIIPHVPLKSPVAKVLILKSIIMWKVIIPLTNVISRRGDRHTAVVHPSLLNPKRQEAEQVISALNIDYLGAPPSAASNISKEYDVIVVARDVSFKNLNIVRAGLKISSTRHGHNCIIINGSKPQEYVKEHMGVLEIGRQERNMILGYLRRSRLHVMLSVELGGYINLEAASCGLPTLCLDGYGASQILGPSSEYCVKLNELQGLLISTRIKELLSDVDGVRKEGFAQKLRSEQFIAGNRKKYFDWLDQSYEQS